MQREMMNAKIDQLHAIVDMARNMAAGLQKQVDAGKMTKEAAIAEFGRRGNSMTFDNGSGYLFGSTMEGVTVLSPDPKTDRPEPPRRRHQRQGDRPRMARWRRRQGRAHHDL